MRVSRFRLAADAAAMLAGWEVHLALSPAPATIRGSYRCSCGGYLSVTVRGVTVSAAIRNEAGSGYAPVQVLPGLAGVEVAFATHDLSAEDEALEAGRRLGRLLLVGPLSFVAMPPCQPLVKRRAAELAAARRRRA